MELGILEFHSEEEMVFMLSLFNEREQNFAIFAISRDQRGSSRDNLVNTW